MDRINPEYLKPATPTPTPPSVKNPELLRAGFTPAPPVKVAINLGALFDLLTGTYILGRYGEAILNGGLLPLTGVTAIGNNFKSTIMHWMMFTAMSRILGSTGSIYDTEISVQEWHLLDFMNRISELNGENMFETGRVVLTDKTQYVGNVWYEMQKAFLENKIKNAAKIMVETPFWDRGNQKPLTIMMPTFTEVDSFSDFETDDVIDMQDKNELGEAGGNTIHMRQGLAKLRFLMEAPRLNCGAYNYLLLSAQLGKESAMQVGAGGKEMPVKSLGYLKNGDKMKNVTGKFTYTMNNCWHSYDSKPMMADDLKGPKYPRNSEDDLRLDTDLNEVHVRQLRGKSGPSGIPITLIISQTEGVLPSLTEFNYLRDNGQYGFEGSNIHYTLAILPEMKLSRTTIRSKIDESEKLRRALNITSEMCQMENLPNWRHVADSGLLCTPKELYEDLKAKGYDWDVLLATRGWWTIDNDKQPVPFLSTLDLLRMRAGLYHPYWMKDLPAGVKEKPKGDRLYLDY